MAYFLELRPGTEPQMLEVPDGKLSREQVCAIAGGEYTVVRTYVSDLVLILCGEGSEDENELATDMLSITDNSVIRGRALLAKDAGNKVAGLSDERVAYWVRKRSENSPSVTA